MDAETAPVSPVAEFNRRATTGAGRYVTREFIEKRSAASVMDLLRSVPGVRIECPRNSRMCHLYIARHQRCDPAYFVDGIPADPAVLTDVFAGLLVVDDGPRAGAASTVVVVTDDGWEIVREGPVTASDISAVLGPRS